MVLRRTKLLAVACAVVLLVAGCGSTHKASAPTTTPATTVPSSTTVEPTTTLPAATTKVPGKSTTTTFVPHTSPLPARVPNNVPERKNVSLEKCAAIPGGWGASGTAANPAKSTVSYRITVYFTDTSATTLDYAQTTVSVAPGKNVPWTASKTFDAPSHVLCVLVGVG
jgi:hypothetical protein